MAKFGEERQVNSKAHEKEIPPFKEDGKYHKIGIDISFVSLNMQFESQTEGVYSADGFNGGTVHMPPSKSGRILFYIRINRELNENNEFEAAYKFQQTADNRLNYIMTRVLTYSHEMVMHAIVDAEDWKDDKKFDLSNIPDEAKKNSKVPVNVQHELMRATNSIWKTEYVDIIANMWTNANPRISIKKVINHLRDFL